MKLFKYFYRWILPLLFTITIGCGHEANDSGLKIATTTTILGNIAETVGRDKVDVVTIVPGGMCPGHFDIKPDDIESVNKAKVLVFHGWEKWLDELTDAAQNKALLKETVDVTGNLMVPENQTKATERITRILSSLDKQNSREYEKASKDYIDNIKNTARKISNETGMLQGVKVIGSMQQKGFLQWLGLEVVAVYDRVEDMNPGDWIKIINTAKENNVKLVVDNLQSGPDTGVGLASEIGAKHIVLSNFPINKSYTATISENVRKICAAIINE